MSFKAPFCDYYFGGVVVDYHDAVAAGFRFYQRFGITPSSFIAFDRALSASGRLLDGGGIGRAIFL